MPRKNYSRKTARRAHSAQLPAIPLGFFDDVEGEYEVTVSNGSGCKILTMEGTQATVWGWAAQAGRQGGLGAGRWEPTDIKLVKALFEAAPFAALV